MNEQFMWQFVQVCRFFWIKDKTVDCGTFLIAWNGLLFPVASDNVDDDGDSNDHFFSECLLLCDSDHDDWRHDSIMIMMMVMVMTVQ